MIFKSKYTLWSLCVFLLTLALSIGLVGGRRYVHCLQCNVYNQGNSDVCGLSELKKYNCTGCLKTYTRSYMHDQWLNYKYISYTSRYCMQVRNYELPEGCYTTGGINSYTRRCYCYSHWCNTSNNIPLSRTLLSVVTVITSTLVYFR